MIFLLKLRAVLFLMVAVFAFSAAQHVFAAAPKPIIADTPCDADYYDSLEARAWLEAQREITQNQNLISKPDSVLAYTCFDKFANVMAEQAENMFSETTRWGTGIIPNNQQSMDIALTNLVGSSLKEYIDKNFQHAYLGERADPLGPGPGGVTGIVGAPYQDCDRMNEIWKIAKCYNFAERASHDGFFTFDEYASGDDKRQLPDLPRQCSAITASYQGFMEKAGITPKDPPPWQFDPITTYFEKFDPYEDEGATEPNCAASEKLPTGVTVKTDRDFITKSQNGGAGIKDGLYDEFICIMPGCFYMPQGKSSGTCKKFSEAPSLKE